MVSAARPHGPARAGEGYVFLGVLVLVVLVGVTATAAVRRWSLQAQREREVELDFRGQQIVQAIGHYWNEPSVGVHELPRTMDDLLEDRRGPRPVHHLRRLFPDPFTGRPDWVVVPGDPQDPQGRFVGVHSASQRPRLAGGGGPVSDQVFVYDIAHGAVVAPSAAASAPASADAPLTPAR